MWTLLPVLSGDGRLISCLLIMHSLFLPVDAVKFTFSNGICVACTENAQQTDESWINFAWLSSIDTSFHHPSFLHIDGHCTHATVDFIELAAEHCVYVIINPSHNSILFQGADVGVN